MPKVKLGCSEFDVNSEEIDASRCGVSEADCVAFAARMTTGEISRLRTLNLVSFILWFFESWLLYLLFHIFLLSCMFHTIFIHP